MDEQTQLIPKNYGCSFNHIYKALTSYESPKETTVRVIAVKGLIYKAASVGTALTYVAKRLEIENIINSGSGIDARILAADGCEVILAFAASVMGAHLAFKYYPWGCMVVGYSIGHLGFFMFFAADAGRNALPPIFGGSADIIAMTAIATYTTASLSQILSAAVLGFKKGNFTARANTEYLDKPEALGRPFFFASLVDKPLTLAVLANLGMELMENTGLHAARRL